MSFFLDWLWNLMNYGSHLAFILVKFWFNVALFFQVPFILLFSMYFCRRLEPVFNQNHCFIVVKRWFQQDHPIKTISETLGFYYSFLHPFGIALTSEVHAFSGFDFGMPVRVFFLYFDAKLVSECLSKWCPFASQGSPWTPPRRWLHFKLFCIDFGCLFNTCSCICIPLSGPILMIFHALWYH